MAEVVDSQWIRCGYEIRNCTPELAGEGLDGGVAWKGVV